MRQKEYLPEEILPPELLRHPESRDNKQNLAHKKRSSKDKIGLGCFIQGVGLLIGIWAFMTIIGPIIGFCLFLFGANLSRDKSFFCSNCGNAVAETSNLCPICGKKLVEDPAETVKRHVNIIILAGCCLTLLYLVLIYKP
jgi:DNA-directed RNA polymerase subunit RPC12/RpoP